MEGVLKIKSDYHIPLKQKIGEVDTFSSNFSSIILHKEKPFVLLSFNGNNRMYVLPPFGKGCLTYIQIRMYVYTKTYLYTSESRQIKDILFQMEGVNHNCSPSFFFLPK